ncbi:brefeldin A-inhibited guanine nucleotide-exchange protein 1-like [Xenia sp. Carnegie-2017]|uniref:brefeldin A-inhibited guanine nucleotide-exchange protein 1-like n=1 Tax=Xenia sp. Carnegie-2017 TaxID=2897299 RepID=UPI001F04BF43|nr:brefeldin A-inhibited guanine nucleotide-exchange protein 1-like [Xenia sp. Carnegie-2017]
MQKNVKTKNVFLSGALQRILLDKETKKSHHSQLKKACETAYMEINAVQGNEKSTGNVSSVTLPPLPGQQTFITADQYFLPFELACQTKCAMIVTIAVDCTQKPFLLRQQSPNEKARLRTFEKARLPVG